MAREHVLLFDPTSLIHGATAAFIGTIVFFKWIGPLTSRWLAPGYSDLPEVTKRDWDDRSVSLVNAAISIVLSVYTLFYDDGMGEDMVWYDSYYARLACAIVVGYMVADIFVMCLWCTVRPGEFLGYICHHAATVFAYAFVSVYGVFCYFAMVRLIAEVSTPFVNFRWFFDKLSVPRSRPYVTANGFLMVLSFLVFRMIAMPFYWYPVWSVTGTESVVKLGRITFCILYVPSFVLDILNTYWFYKMCKGFIKAVRNLQNNNDKSKSV